MDLNNLEAYDPNNQPAYLLAADNHTIGNTEGGSWFDPSTWESKGENALKFTAGAVVSGLASMYNTGVVVGNFFGGDFEQADTRRILSDYDQDLGKYYTQNRDAIDTVGFIGTSFVPGIGGVKLLNAGQKMLADAMETGVIGANMSRATGLLVPKVEMYVQQAAQNIINNQATFSAINQAGIKALASGVWQNTLEGLAFEGAVQATMFKSPVLEQQDGWDIAKNLVMGGALGGAIGGALQGAISYRSIYKKVAEAEGKHITPFGARNAEQTFGSASGDIILNAYDRDVGLVPMPNSPYFDAAQKAYDARVTRINADIRTSTHKLAGESNTELANFLSDATESMDHTQVMAAYLHADQVGSFSSRLTVEKEIADFEKNYGRKPDHLQVSYVKNFGDDVGTVFKDAPKELNLADVARPKQLAAGVYSSIEDEVLNRVRSKGYKPSKVWNLLDETANAHGGFEAEARQIWASKLLKEVPDDMVIHNTDLPVLERALEDKQLKLKLIDKNGKVLQDGFNSTTELTNYVYNLKDALAAQLLKQGKTSQEIAKITNQTVNQIDGLGVAGNDGRFAWQKANDTYAKQLKDNEQVPATKSGDADLRFLPQYTKIGRRLPEEFTSGSGGHVMDGMTWLRTQQKQAEEAVDRVLALHASEALSTPRMDQEILSRADRQGAGAKLGAFAEGTYGDPKSHVNFIGSITKKLRESYRGATSDTMEGALAGIGRNQDAAIEWHTINQKVTRSGTQWIRDEDGNLVDRALVKKHTSGDGEVDWDAIREDAVPDVNVISIKNEEVSDLLDAHMDRYAFRRNAERDMRAAQGYENHKDPAVFQPVRPNIADHPYVAFVKDPTVTGTGHTSMIFASSERQLAEMMEKVPAPYKTYTKKDAEEFYKARNEYDFQRTLHENYIDSDLKNKGIMSEFFTKTDPQKIINDTLQQHLRDDDILAREMMRARHQAAFDYLADQGEAYAKYSGKIGSSPAKAAAESKNPYMDYVKTALDVSKISEYPILNSFNKALDGAVSKVMAEVGDIWNGVKKPEDLNKINEMLESYGMKNPYMDTATLAWANHTAPKGELTKFIRGANAVLSKLTLGLDPINSLVNGIGANVLRGTELKQITDAIRGGDKELAGKLADLAKIDLPGGVDQMTSIPKLISNSISNFVKDDGTLMAKYKEMGFVKGYSEQFKQVLDDFTLKGTESVNDLQSRLSRALKKANELSEMGEKLTGNKFVEEFNRFISANVMDQLTGLGVAKNLLSQEEANAYINTFVNRVEGNTIASQRPMIFQGPIGQAVGLFQSYQFNLMQQMFRYVAEGSKKDAAMLLGLQGTFFGMQGLPGFNFINQHIVGSLSGNTEHKDLYDITFGMAGKQMGEWLMYGLPSNMLQANIYSRGDINPRQVTLIPTSLPDVPVVQAYGKLFGSMYSAANRIGAGAPVWEAFLQGLEHNGISRPLAGLAQTMQAAGPMGKPYATSSQGTILGSNDLMSWSTAVRLAGARPLDEAIVNDTVYKINAYDQMDKAKMDNLAAAVKESYIQGNNPDQEGLNKFAYEYAKAGGKQWNFNQYMLHEMTQANTSRANMIAAGLTNPYAQRMQALMGYANQDSLVSY